MDDLLSGAEGVGLNVVCDEQAPSLTSTASSVITLKKKTTKRKNKYEKRRERARRAREEKARSTRGDGNTLAGAVGDATADKAENQEDYTARDSSPRGPTDDAAPSSEPGGRTVARKPAKEETSEHRRCFDEPTAASSADAAAAEPPPESTAQKITSSSRRRRGGGDDDALQNEEDRARYMAEYHARPLEMDRRSGASSIIKPSEESSHIFDAVEEEEEEDDDDNDEGGGYRNHTEEEKESGNAGAIEDGDEASSSCPFRSLGLHDRLASAVTSPRGPFRHERPTVIQTRALRSLLATNAKRKGGTKTASDRCNLFVKSETGSGKTLAYLLPIIQSLAVDSKTNELKKVDRQVGGTRCLILTPTRELATQTALVAEKLCLHSFSWIVPGCLSGGEKRKSEKARLRKGVSILIATPGRLLDHLGKTECLLMSLKGKLEFFVLDEADRLLDMGLGGQVEQIVQRLRANQPRSGAKRDGVTWRSVLVSATVTETIEGLSRKILGGDTWVWARAKKDETKHAQEGKSLTDTVKAGSTILNADTKECRELKDATPRQLAQLHMIVSAKLRLTALVAFLVARVKNGERTVVFMSTCDGVDFHYALFSAMDSILPDDDDEVDSSERRSRGIFGGSCPIYRLHGNVPHTERHMILNNFADGADADRNPTSRNGKRRASILIATDVAARGLNLPGVDWILQYDPPCETSDYVHRAGRAARAGKSGHALLFLLPSEHQYVDVLKLRGLEDVSALSLASTLQSAAKICTDVTIEGEKKSGGGFGRGSSSRDGEAFSAAIQNRFEACIVNDDLAYKERLAKKTTESSKKRGKKSMSANHATGELLESARHAFSAYVRAYSAKEKAVRHIFCTRALHLGHIARSFALREAPSVLVKANQVKKGESFYGNEPSLKATGRKRNIRLAFDTSQKDDNGFNVSAREESSSGAQKAKANDLAHKRGRLDDARRARKTVSFVDYSDNFNDNKKGMKDKVAQKREAPPYNGAHANAHARMMTAAKLMQSGGMEFF